jgi:tetratricopeptide (TPR) repeat protein
MNPSAPIKPAGQRGGNDDGLLRLAAQVDRLLAAAARELGAAASPHRAALLKLGITPDGFVPMPCHADALAIWNDFRKRFPEDEETLHHLAIAHHARAFDLECSDKPDRANDDWQAARDLWRKLWTMDAFWDRLAARVCPSGKRDAIDNLQESLPLTLLTIHFDIALDSKTPIDRARYHVALARSSRFPAEPIAQMRQMAYEQTISGVPASVWMPSEMDPAIIKIGTDAIQKYLNIDSDFLPALSDNLSLRYRLLLAWNTQLRALPLETNPERTRLLEMVNAAAREYKPYLDRLVPHLKELTEDTRQKLMLWYRVNGQWLCARDEEAIALNYFEQGMKVGTQEDEEYRMCREDLGEAHAFLAMRKAEKEAPDARDACEAVRRRTDLSLIAHHRLANGFAMLKDFRTALEVCDNGLAMILDPAEIDDDAIDAFNQRMQRLQEMRGQIAEARQCHIADGIIDRAQEHFNNDRHDEAMKLMNQAAAMAPKMLRVYHTRCQFNLQLDLIVAARADLTSFRKYAKSDEMKKAADELEEKVRKKEADGNRFGPNGQWLRRQAAERLGRGEYREASDYLRRAVAGSPAATRGELEKELCVTLSQWAADVVTKTQGDDTIPVPKKRVVYTEACRRLEEAVRLDPSNSTTRRNLEAVRKMISKM